MSIDQSIEQIVQASESRIQDSIKLLSSSVSELQKVMAGANSADIQKLITALNSTDLAKAIVRINSGTLVTTCCSDKPADDTVPSTGGNSGNTGGSNGNTGGNSGSGNTGGTGNGNSGNTGGNSGSGNVPSTGNGAVQILPLFGMNMSGLGNNPYVQNAQMGTHYRFPDEKYFVKYAAMGCKFYRFPIAVERLLAGQGADLNTAILKQITDAMDLAQKYGAKVLIDPHNYHRMWVPVPSGYTKKSGFSYMTYNGVTCEWRPIGMGGDDFSQVINTDGYANFLSKLATALKSHPAFWGISLTNEPHNREPGIDVNSIYFGAVQKYVDALASATAGADRKIWIVVGGGNYQSARQWKTVSGDALLKIQDKTDQVIFEAHNYLDGGMSGGGAWSNRNEVIPVGNGIEMVRPFVEWCVANNKRGMLGEHGYPENNTSAEAATLAMFDYLVKYNIISFQWCAGPGWPAGDVLATDDDNGTMKNNINASKKYFGVTTAKYR